MQEETSRDRETEKKEKPAEWKTDRGSLTFLIQNSRAIGIWRYCQEEIMERNRKLINTQGVCSLTERVNHNLAFVW